MSESLTSGRIAGRAELTLADQYAGLFWAAPRAFRIGVVVGAAICLTTIALELARARPNPWVVGLLAFFLLSCLVMVAVGHWRMSAEQRRVDYLIDSERIVIRDGTGRALVTPWAKVSAVHERGSGIVLKQQRGGQWLVKRAFSAGDLATLKAMK